MNSSQVILNVKLFNVMLKINYTRTDKGPLIYCQPKKRRFVHLANAGYHMIELVNLADIANSPETG